MDFKRSHAFVPSDDCMIFMARSVATLFSRMLEANVGPAFEQRGKFFEVVMMDGAAGLNQLSLTSGLTTQCRIASRNL